jgi:hypothetical protein
VVVFIYVQVDVFGRNRTVAYYEVRFQNHISEMRGLRIYRETCYPGSDSHASLRLCEVASLRVCEVASLRVCEGQIIDSTHLSVCPTIRMEHFGTAGKVFLEFYVGNIS